MENQPQNEPMEAPTMNEPKGRSCPLLKGQSIYNILSGLAIIALFVIFFMGNKNEGSPITGSNGPVSYAFVETDTVLSHYVLVDTLKNKLQLQTAKLEKDLSAKEQALQSKIATYQKNMQNGRITSADEAKRQEQILGQEQQNLLQLRDQYMGQIAQFQADINQEILDSLTSTIKQHPKEYPYDFIFGYAKGGGILYANPKLDITKSIIEKLNKNYSGK